MKIKTKLVVVITAVNLLGIGQGDFTITLAAASKDEIGNISRSFNFAGELNDVVEQFKV